MDKKSVKKDLRKLKEIKLGGKNSEKASAKEIKVDKNSPNKLIGKEEKVSFEELATRHSISKRRFGKNPILILRDMYYSYIRRAGIEMPPEKYLNFLIIKIAFFAVFFGLFYGVYLFFSQRPSLVRPLLSILIVFAALNLIFYLKLSLNASSRIKKMETVFPDVIQLMASNLRAGMTIDRAFVLSARPEFYPLDKEIIMAGKDIATGKDIVVAFKNMASRIGSEKISKTVSLIISGIRSGGNISTLLEQTSSNMREKEFIEKRISANILMYVIFIFFAVSVGAPLLFGLSSILVEILIKIIGSLPADSMAANLPFTLSKVSISPVFIKWFAIAFIFVTDILASFILGIVSKGDERSGLKFILPLFVVSYSIFFLVRIVLSKFLLQNLSLGM